MLGRLRQDIAARAALAGAHAAEEGPAEPDAAPEPAVGVGADPS
jgi:hypothetical protein